MFFSEPIHLYFSNPAKDPLGRKSVSGQMSFLADSSLLQWRINGNVFVGDTHELQEIEISYATIAEIQLEKHWLKATQLTIRLSQPDLISEIPGAEVGKLTLFIDKQSKKEVKKLAEHIDFKKSILILEKTEERIQDLKKS